MDFFEQVREKYIFINHPNILAKINLNEAFKHFIESDADITMIYKKQEDPWGEYINCDKMNVSESGEVLNIGMNLGTEDNFLMSLKTSFMKKEVFIKIVKEAIEKGECDDLQGYIMENREKYKSDLL